MAPSLWITTYSCLFIGLWQLRPLLRQFGDYFSQQSLIRAYRKSANHLRLLKEMLETGMVPEAEEWQKIKNFPEPWGQALFLSFSELRAQGAAVVPTLTRALRTLDEQVELIQEGKVKSAQSMGQAYIGLILVPLFALVLWFAVPELQSTLRDFLLIVLFSFFLSSLAFIWLIQVVENARYGNIRKSNRAWLVSVNVCLERLNALICTGMPGDLAWRKMVEELSVSSVNSNRKLALTWKSNVWDPDFILKSEDHSECERLILQVGTEARRSIQTSLIEGRPCLERIESVHRNFLLDLKLAIGRELSLLPNRCLKPLFVFILPSVMVLLFGSLALCFQKYIS
jgi:hypothetical protein